jgi:cytochrome c553
MLITTDPVRLCSQCHEAMPGRPAAIQQIEVASHTDGQVCISCHNPHAPKPATALATVVGDVAAGRQAAAACSGCHGAAGISTDAATPNLAGQYAPYLASVLAAHPPVTRPDGSTVQVAHSLGAKAIGDLSVYFASLDCSASPSPTQSKPGDVAAGEARATLCVACHGDGGRGSNPAWPRLAGQRAAYLISRLNAIKAGTLNVPVMSFLASGLSDADIANLAAYYSSSRCRL